jgi:hypothetical protein
VRDVGRLDPNAFSSTAVIGAATIGLNRASIPRHWIHLGAASKVAPQQSRVTTMNAAASTKIFAILPTGAALCAVSMPSRAAEPVHRTIEPRVEPARSEESYPAFDPVRAFHTRFDD